jgi:hypothetical protein
VDWACGLEQSNVDGLGDKSGRGCLHLTCVEEAGIWKESDQNIAAESKDILFSLISLFKKKGKIKLSP